MVLAGRLAMSVYRLACSVPECFSLMIRSVQQHVERPVAFTLYYPQAPQPPACLPPQMHTGAAGKGGDSGELAQFVSNASFATLTLIYTFTELLDLSDQVAGWF